MGGIVQSVHRKSANRGFLKQASLNTHKLEALSYNKPLEPHMDDGTLANSFFIYIKIALRKNVLDDDLEGGNEQIALFC